MSDQQAYYMYITASISRVLYIGMTGNLAQRIEQHKEGTYGSDFTRLYNVNRLVYFEEFETADAAIRREKQLKKWSRSKKVWLIERDNPQWHDLSLDWQGWNR